MYNQKVPGKPWWVWASLWTGTVLSLLSMLLYILILDIDIPSIKPRPALENATAAIVYISHAINILASAICGFAILQQEYVVVLCWVMWCGIHILAMVILSIMSCFTVLSNIPARLILHIVCGLVSLLGGLVMLRVYSRRYARDPAPSRHNYDWRQDKGAMEAGGGGVNNMDISKESNVL